MVSRNTKPEPSVDRSASTQSAFVSPRSKAPVRQAIALISDHSDPAVETGEEKTGGQNVYVRQVGEALAKLGWQVDMFTRKTNAEDATIVQHSPHCRTIRLSAGPQQFIPRDELFQYMPEFVQAFQKFQRKEGTNYPLVHTNHWRSAWVGLQLKQQSNIQLVHTYHSIGAVKYQSLLKCPTLAETRLEIEQQILEAANCIVATSPQEEETLRKLFASQGCIEVIPCGTDISNFHEIPKAEARTKLGFSADEAIVLYVGRFDPSKGMETLVQACALLQEKAGQTQPESAASDTLTPIAPNSLRLVIVGDYDPNDEDGLERQRIEQMVREAGLSDQTRLVGRVGHNLLPLYYTAADVCAIPSHYEPFGMVAIEAMACGTPVVASDVGGLRFTVVPEETGLLVPAKNAEAFAQAIERVLTDEVWARRLKKQASARVQENFSWSGVAVHLSDLYRRLLAQSISHEFFHRPSTPRQEEVESSPLLATPAETLTIAS
jgi:D-inositol-3-phosphate glycosyltransferase